LRPPDQFHGLGAALAPQRRRRRIVGNHSDRPFFVLGAALGGSTVDKNPSTEKGEPGRGE
jgi:hypothetical protein